MEHVYVILGGKVKIALIGLVNLTALIEVLVKMVFKILL